MQLTLSKTGTYHSPGCLVDQWQLGMPFFYRAGQLRSTAVTLLLQSHCGYVGLCGSKFIFLHFFHLLFFFLEGSVREKNRNVKLQFCKTASNSWFKNKHHHHQQKNLQCELAGFLGVYQKACLAHELGEIFCSVTCKEKNTRFVWIMNAKYMIFTHSIAVK